MTAPKKIPKSIVDAIDRFSEAAKSHGWQEDQGYGNGPENAEKGWKEARRDLEAAIRRHLPRSEGK